MIRNRGTSDTGLPPRPPQPLPPSLPMEWSASRRARRRAPEAAGRAVAVAAVTAAGSRNSRRSHRFHPRGTSSPRTRITASVRQKETFALPRRDATDPGLFLWPYRQCVALVTENALPRIDERPRTRRAAPHRTARLLANEMARTRCCGAKSRGWRAKDAEETRSSCWPGGSLGERRAVAGVAGLEGR